MTLYFLNKPTLNYSILLFFETKVYAKLFKVELMKNNSNCIYHMEFAAHNT